MRSTAVSGCSPNSWATRAAQPRSPRREHASATAWRMSSGVGSCELCTSETNSASVRKSSDCVTNIGSSYRWSLGRSTIRTLGRGCRPASAALPCRCGGRASRRRVSRRAGRLYRTNRISSDSVAEGGHDDGTPWCGAGRCRAAGRRRARREAARHRRPGSGAAIARRRPDGALSDRAVLGARPGPTGGPAGRRGAAEAVRQGGRGAGGPAGSRPWDGGQDVTTVLVADDDADIRDLVAFKLEQAGLEVITAEDGQQALEQARLRRPNLAVLDISMPVLSGIDVCRMLRAGAATADMLIIMLTARVQEQDVEGGFSAGADDYVTKPFSPRELVSRIQALLTRTRA